MEWALRIEGLIKNYGRVEALRGLDMLVPQGEVYGLLGINGAGKTTTLGIVSGFLLQSGGSFEIKGKLGCLPQDASLYPHRRISSQLGFLARLSGIDASSRDREVRRCLEIVGLGDLACRKPVKLSHGQRKRLHLAQALLGNPAILLLDEPTAGLDPEQASRIRNLVSKLAGEHTVVISSHHLSEVEEVCGWVGVVHTGRMIYQGATTGLAGGGDRVLYRFDKSLNFSDFLPLVGITKVKAVSSCSVWVHFDPGLVTQADLNRLILAKAGSNGIGILEISSGGSLEEGFLELLS